MCLCVCRVCGRFNRHRLLLCFRPLSVRLYAPLRPIIQTHSFLVGSYQGGESDILGVVLMHRGSASLLLLPKDVSALIA